MEDLEATDFILKEHGEEAGVQMPACANGKFMLGTGRVVVTEYDPSLVALNIGQVARFEPTSLREQLEQNAPQILHLLGVPKQRIAANQHK